MAFWEAVREARQPGGPLAATPVPETLAVLSYHDPAPADDALVCRVPAADKLPSALRLEQ